MLLNGGPLDGTDTASESLLDSARPMLLTEVDGVWHAYLAVPHPEQEMVLSHVGPVERPRSLRSD